MRLLTRMPGSTSSTLTLPDQKKSPAGVRYHLASPAIVSPSNTYPIWRSGVPGGASRIMGAVDEGAPFLILRSLVERATLTFETNRYSFSGISPSFHKSLSWEVDISCVRAAWQ